MIRAIIIEDEKNNAERLERLLSDHCKDISVEAVANSVMEGVDAINAHKPNLIFLDIELPDGTGFDIFDHFTEPQFEVIFTTAFDHFAIKAIRFAATDYLLKPIDKDELISATAKILSKGEQVGKLRRNHGIQERLKLGELNSIALPTSDGFKIVPIDNVIRCEADGNYTFFHLINNERVLVSKSMKEFEDLFEGYNFCRIHHSHLINMKHAIKYHRGEGGRVTMSDNKSVDVSKRKKDQFLKMLFKA